MATIPLTPEHIAALRRLAPIQQWLRNEHIRLQIEAGYVMQRLHIIEIETQAMLTQVYAVTGMPTIDLANGVIIVPEGGDDHEDSP